MSVSSSALPLYAFANNSVAGETKQNPYYAGEDISQASLDSLQTEASVTKTYESKTYYSAGLQLYRIVRDNLVKRNESIEIHYLSKNKLNSRKLIWNAVDKLFDNAWDDALSVSGVDGDYVKWAVQSYGYGDLRVYETYKDGYYFYTLELLCNYYDTAAQENEVDKVVNSFVSSIDTNKLTDCEIIRKVHDFICSKATYDDDAAYNINGRYYAATAYGALVRGKCVCQGYAVAFYRLCKELGYSCRFVSSDKSEGCHAWNIVGLDGKFYYVDATWDDLIFEGKYDAENYYYFLVNYETLQSKDSMQHEHKLDEQLYDNEYFWENYREHIDENNYDFSNKNLISQSTITLSKSSYTYTGNQIKPGVSVATNGYAEDYTVSYSNNTNTGVASVIVRSKSSGEIIGQRSFEIVPKKMTSLSLADSGRETNAIRLNWSKAPGGISGYKLEIYKDGKWSVYKTLSAGATTCKLSSLSPSTTYKFRIRSYKTVSKRTLYGAYSNVYINATKPKTPAASSISSKSNSITFKWKKAACSGYEIQYSQSSSMKNAKTVTASSKALSKTVSKLKKGKKYYFRVRAYKSFTNASGTKLKCCSSWSAKKSISCK